MFYLRPVCVLYFLVVVLGLSPSWVLAFSEETLAEKDNVDVISEADLATEEGLKPGLHPKLIISGNFSWVDNRQVVGSDDGSALSFGYIIAGQLVHLSDNLLHEFQTSLDWQLGYMKTPTIDTLLKNSDVIDYKASYLYHLAVARWFGPFAGFRLLTHMLPGYAVRNVDTTVHRIDANGAPMDGVDNSSGEDVALPYKTYDAGSKISLTNAFAPLTLREMLGVFAKPLEKKKILLDFRAGLGAWQTFVQDGYTVSDDTDGALQIQQLENSVQLGPQADLLIEGLIRGGLSYMVRGMIMWPFYKNVDTGLDGASLINAEIEAGLSVKLVTWASLDYTFKAYRLPLIVDSWQVQNNILLSVSYSAFGE